MERIPPRNQETLITLIKEGDRKAYKEVFAEYYHKLCVYILGFTSDRSLAEDVAQLSLLKLWEKKEKLRTDGSISGFLYKTAFNEFAAIYRKSKKLNTAILEIKQEGLQEMIELDKDVIEDRLLQVDKAIEALPSKCKEIFLLCKKDGKSYKEIAKGLNISVKTVENQIGKALKLIRDRVGKKTLNLFLLAKVYRVYE